MEAAPFPEVPLEASAYVAFPVDAFQQEGRVGVPVGVLHHPVAKEYLVLEAWAYRVASQAALCQEEEQVGKHQEEAFLE